MLAIREALKNLVADEGKSEETRKALYDTIQAYKVEHPSLYKDRTNGWNPKHIAVSPTADILHALRFEEWTMLERILIHWNVKET